MSQLLPICIEASGQSIDMYTSVTPSSIIFLGGSSILSSVIKTSESNGLESSFTTLLISATNLDKVEVPTLKLPKNHSIACGSRLSIDESPTPKQCSYAQTMINGELPAILFVCLHSVIFRITEYLILDILKIQLPVSDTICSALSTSIAEQHLLESSNALISFPLYPTIVHIFFCLIAAINALCGIGILSTPYALKEGGWLSLLILLVFGIITCYSGVLLKRCLERSPGLETHPDIGQAAFWHGQSNLYSCKSICFVLNPVTKYAVTTTPVAFGLEDLLPSARLRSYFVSILIRTMLVGSTLAIALTVPYFGSVMALN
ncbi:hypothetical protein ACH5RR_005322 [Cinchona calisaya]|uniref:Amino acid transporter transmembrane domain-containing protein n=1 Tax=Cinchona calisaya TaxID=153742 RepID=A0ABD3AL36_9GENT